MRTIAIAILALTVLTVSAQKKELSQARTYIKSGKDFDKAEKLMTDLIAKDSVNRQNKKVYATWYESVLGQYQQINEKIYLHQKYDTATVYTLLNRMYRVAESLDSLDAKPDEKGRVKLDYRKGNAEQLNKLRRNLYFGGTYNLRRNNYQEAFNFFETYIDAAQQPLFASYDYAKNDSLMSTAAYWATLAGYRMKDATRTLRYSDLALTDTSKAVFVRQYICEAYLWQQNDTEYLKALEDGFAHHPEYPYFFPRLGDYYNKHGQVDKTLQLSNEALIKYPDRSLFLLAKSVALLELDRYDECVEVSSKLIEKDPELPEPYFNIATCYLNQALKLEQKNEPRLYREKLYEYYSKARPQMEQYRKLAPNDQKRWAPALYRIYLNLNLGQQFEEIDRLMKK
jgi:predicted Zn-dependent protease